MPRPPAILAALLLCVPVLCAMPASRAAAIGTTGSAGTAAAPGGSAPPPASAIENAAARLTGQDATYTLQLERAHGNVIGATGTMTYKVEDVCHAWASQQRLEMTLSNNDGTDVKTISDYATWESKDGRQMNFHLRQTTDGAVTEEVDGTASLARLGGPGVVHYTQPKPEVVTLPAGTLLPTTHTAMIIAAAEAGQHFVAVPLFDGTGTDGAQDTFVLIEGWNKPKPVAFAALSPQPSGHVHVAFFSRKPGTLMPDYEVGMRYWQGGVANALRMDFGDFVMDGTLKTLSVPSSPHC
ncbi:MAG TPA: DUF1849 family protein [Acetobacteraceae bacterium]|jgi:hypothetical protein|nr:DUF1849 family protein [Acetobacteraceae bacterium]